MTGPCKPYRCEWLHFDFMVTGSKAADILTHPNSQNVAKESEGYDTMLGNTGWVALEAKFSMLATDMWKLMQNSLKNIRCYITHTKVSWRLIKCILWVFTFMGLHIPLEGISISQAKPNQIPSRVNCLNILLLFLAASNLQDFPCDPHLLSPPHN